MIRKIKGPTSGASVKYPLSDGKEITVIAGVVTDIKEPEMFQIPFRDEECLPSGVGGGSASFIRQSSWGQVRGFYGRDLHSGEWNAVGNSYIIAPAANLYKFDIYCAPPYGALIPNLKSIEFWSYSGVASESNVVHEVTVIPFDQMKVTETSVPYRYTIEIDLRELPLSMYLRKLKLNVNHGYNNSFYEFAIASVSTLTNRNTFVPSFPDTTFAYPYLQELSVQRGGVSIDGVLIPQATSGNSILLPAGPHTFTHTHGVPYELTTGTSSFIRFVNEREEDIAEPITANSPALASGVRDLKGRNCTILWGYHLPQTVVLGPNIATDLEYLTIDGVKYTADNLDKIQNHLNACRQKHLIFAKSRGEQTKVSGGGSWSYTGTGEVLYDGGFSGIANYAFDVKALGKRLPFHPVPPVLSVAVDTNSIVETVTYLVDATAGNVTITLPAATDAIDCKFTVKKIDASVNTVTIAVTDGISNLIEGVASVVLSTQYQKESLVTDGVLTFYKV